MLSQGFDRRLCVLVSSSTILLYDHLVTFSDEVHRIWNHPISALTSLFILNRYATLVLATVSMVITSLPDTRPTKLNVMIYNSTLCRTLTTVTAVMGVVSAISISATGFAALRVWAIWHGNLRVIIPVLVLSLLPLGGNVYVIGTLINRSLESQGSFTPVCDLLPPELGLGVSSYILSITLQVATVVCEALVLILIWIKTFKRWREAQRVHVRTKITTMLLRDGTIYFIAMLATNAFFYGYYGTYLPQSIYTIPQAVLNSVLITRFLLDLRGVNLSPSIGTGFSTIPEMQGSTAIGNMGAPPSDGFPILSDGEYTGIGEDEERREGASAESPSFASVANNIPMTTPGDSR